MEWNNICLIAQLLNLTTPSAHLEYNDRFKTGSHQGRDTATQRQFPRIVSSFEQEISCPISKHILRKRTSCSQILCVTEHVVAIFQSFAVNFCNAIGRCHLCRKQR